MTETGLTSGAPATEGRRMWRVAVIAVGLGGCVNVSAPDKPIEINLNINVTQEVVYRLDGEAKSVIKDNPGIF